MFKKVNPRQSFPQMEEDLIKKWREDKTFEKSVESRPHDKEYVFYDGPPFATGLPHYGHLLAGTMKDVVPRYWTMRGYRVERRFGWDCHGLPVENEVEKELNLNGKKEIEEKVGVYEFNEKCRSIVLRYTAEWEKTVERMGRWVDFKDDYKTMNPEYMESIWWVFRQLWDKGLIYEGRKPMHVCPRCVTPLSNFEVTLGYKDVTDWSGTVKFPLSEEAKDAIGVSGNVFVLAWTTTPWTLPGNVALAFGREIDYVLAKYEDSDEVFVVAESLVNKVLGEEGIELLGKVDVKKLEGKHYLPLFSYYEDKELEGVKYVMHFADFVTTEDGTGIVHIAPMFGDDDYNLGKEQGTAMIQHVGMDGNFVEEVTDFAGKFVKAVEPNILDLLEKNGLLFKREKYKHSYPHCWRCDSPLLNFAMSSWFIDIDKLKEGMMASNQSIHWVPEHLKDGRFGKWLENARDWCISRNRFWGAPLPVWVCEKTGEKLCIGSIEELEKLSGEKVTDLHKHFVDEIVIKKDGKEFKRIPEVLDCWFESGAMPYAQNHYPFENQEKFENNFPAEFIAEGLDQTRGWFYTLVVLGTALFGKSPFKNVIVNGLVLAEDGKKMSKRLKNYPDPQLIFDKYGADAMRFYLMNSPVVRAEPLRFSERGVEDVVRKILLPLWNSYSFFVTYANLDDYTPRVDLVETDLAPESENPLDKWIVSVLEQLLKSLTEEMDNYDLQKATEPIADFIDSLTNWYIRRSRRRFWKSESDEDKTQAYDTLYYCLVKLSQIMAPFTPFIAEEIYTNLTSRESVHLSDWPNFEDNKIDLNLNSDTALIRLIVTLGHAVRASSQIKVRQPLARLEIALPDHIDKNVVLEQRDLILDELNVKELELLNDTAGVVERNVVVNARLLGPKYGSEVQKIINMVKNGEFEVCEDGSVKVGDFVLSGEEVEIGYNGKEGFDVASEKGVVVVLDTTITDILRQEGYARDLVRFIQDMRKEADFMVDDRIIVSVEANGELNDAMEEFSDYIMEETLCDKLEKIALDLWDFEKEVLVNDLKTTIKIKKS